MDDSLFVHICGCCVGAMWAPCGRCVGAAWVLHGRCVGAVMPTESRGGGK